MLRRLKGTEIGLENVYEGSLNYLGQQVISEKVNGRDIKEGKVS